jgi:hypothetical protein
MPKLEAKLQNRSAEKPSYGRGSTAQRAMYFLSWLVGLLVYWLIG